MCCQEIIFPLCSVGVRLTGSTRCSGRVEIYQSGSWGTVCGDGWDLNDAQVVCREVNCGTALSAQLVQFGEGTGPIWLSDVACSGSESYLTQCSHRGFGKYNCTHSQDASVTCSGDENSDPSSDQHYVVIILTIITA